MYNVFKLHNGLKIVLENIDYVNSVSAGLWVKNGSRNENASQNGISHFIEHMFFKGTEKRSAFNIAECIEDVGGQINAFTGKEATCFYVKVLDSHIDLALDVISDMMFHSKFETEDIEKEKAVVIEEINMSEDSPEDVLSDLHSRAMWGGNSISYPILGSKENVNSFTREQITDYIKYHYTPENSVISICGKFDVDEVKYLLDKYFGTWENPSAEDFEYSKPEFKKNCLFREKNIEQVHLALGMCGIKNGDDDLYTLLLLSNVLGGGASSILFQKIREEKSLCYSIYTYISSFDNIGAVTIYTGLNSDYVCDAITIIKHEVDKFIKDGIDSEKLAKLKEQLKANYILGMENTTSRMFNNGKSMLFLNKVSTAQEIMDKIDDIDNKRIRLVMEKTLKLGIQSAAFVGKNVDIDTAENIIQKDIYPFAEAPNLNI